MSDPYRGPPCTRINHPRCGLQRQISEFKTLFEHPLDLARASVVAVLDVVGVRSHARQDRPDSEEGCDELGTGLGGRQQTGRRHENPKIQNEEVLRTLPIQLDLEAILVQCAPVVLLSSSRSSGRSDATLGSELGIELLEGRGEALGC